MTFLGLLSSEVHRLTARRVVRYGICIAMGIIAIIVVVAAVQSETGASSNNVMRLVSPGSDRSSLQGASDDDLVVQISIYVFILIVGVSATAIGGDYRAGTVGTLLTWEPRRARLAATRLLTVAIVAAAMYLFLIGVFIGGWWTGAATRGSTSGADSEFWIDLAAAAGRGVTVAVVLGVITASVAFLTRNTVGAVIVWFGYLVGIEGMLANQFEWLRPGLIGANFAAFFGGKDVVFETPDTYGQSVTRYIAHPGSGLVRLLVIAMVLAGLAVLAFRRRDVT